MTGKIIRIALLAILSLVLASCTINAPATEAALKAQQGTSSGDQPVVAQQTAQALAIALTTSANPTTYDQVGRQITFTYLIRNTGSASLGPTQCTVTDTLINAAPFNCGNANITLAPNETVTCTATYTVNQADVNAVSITSTASASCGGTGPVTAPPVTINKGAVPPANPANLSPGSTISHTVVDGEWIWQLGRCYGVDPSAIIAANRQLPDPAQISPKMVLTIPNLGSAGTIYGPPCVVEHTVKSGETWTSIAQLYNADPNIMQLISRNSLTVGSKVFVPKNSASSTPTVSKSLTLTTTANPTTYTQVNQQITFTYVIKNSGNTSLGPAQFTVSDTLISTTPINCGNPNTTIAPGTTVTCSATYTVKQADLGAVSITNIATASGGGAGPSASASTTVNRGSVGALTLTTTANPTTYDQVNQQITFQYVITNSGASALGPDLFKVTDTLISATPFDCGLPNTTLAAGATVTCSAIYTITQNDMNAASVSNLANAAGGGVSTTQTATAMVTKAVKSISLTTTASALTYNQAGQQITFTYVIKNTGTVALGPGQFTVSDNLLGGTPVNCGAAGMTLAPTATVTCSGTYTIKDADVTAVSVTSVAVATGPGVIPSSPATATVNKQ